MDNTYSRCVIYCQIKGQTIDKCSRFLRFKSSPEYETRFVYQN
jgi:hypothetical protein